MPGRTPHMQPLLQLTGRRIPTCRVTLGRIQSRVIEHLRTASQRALLKQQQKLQGSKKKTSVKNGDPFPIPPTIPTSAQKKEEGNHIHNATGTSPTTVRLGAALRLRIPHIPSFFTPTAPFAPPFRKQPRDTAKALMYTLPRGVGCPRENRPMPRALFTKKRTRDLGPMYLYKIMCWRAWVGGGSECSVVGWRV